MCVALLCVIMLCAMLLCATALAEEDPFGGAQRLERNEVYELDLDGDGKMEKVQLIMLGEEASEEEETEDVSEEEEDEAYSEEEAEEETYDEMDVEGEEYEPEAESGTLQLIVQTDELVYNADTYICFSEEAFAVDLDGDGNLEILLSGDEASADYFTWCLKFDREAGLTKVPFADANRGDNTGEYGECGYGRIDAIDGNVLTMTGSQDALGTWWCSRQFTLRDGRFELDDGGAWIVIDEFDEMDDPEFWEYGALTLARELNVTLEDGSAATLKPGEQLVVTETDKVSYVKFVTKDGVRGTISVEPDVEEGWGFKIGGLHEYEYFDSIPYSD